MMSELLKNNFSKYMDFKVNELDFICSFYKPRNVQKKEYLLRMGEICRFEGLVANGCFKIFTIDHEGNEKILYFAAEGWWLMEIDSFLNQTSSELSIQALEESQVLMITKSDKERLYEALPKVDRLFRIMSQTAVAAWQRRLVRSHTMNADERYDHFITTYPTIANRVTNKQIASYLGITPEFVSKIRKRRLTSDY
ncbi:MAG: Crp/Fnr family transcriptional regulator [Cyclobacteriaceae bacterium]